MAERNPVSVSILDKEYLIACSDDERDELMASVRYLNKRMKEIRDSGKVVGLDRVAVMAALNITHELLRKDASGGNVGKTVMLRLRAMQEKIETALTSGQQLEF